jgi:hypothetical protein
MLFSRTVGRKCFKVFCMTEFKRICKRNENLTTCKVLKLFLCLGGPPRSATKRNKIQCNSNKSEIIKSETFWSLLLEFHCSKKGKVKISYFDLQFLATFQQYPILRHYYLNYSTFSFSDFYLGSEFPIA